MWLYGLLIKILVAAPCICLAHRQLSHEVLLDMENPVPHDTKRSRCRTGEPNDFLNIVCSDLTVRPAVVMVTESLNRLFHLSVIGPRLAA